jgi:hypothetical protein
MSEPGSDRDAAQRYVRLGLEGPWEGSGLAGRTEDQEAVCFWPMARVNLWNRDRDLMAEYQALKKTRPDVARAVRDAITVVARDPATAERRYSTLLDHVAKFLAMPFLSPDGVTALTWRHDPDGDDAIEIVDFSEPWGDVPMPNVWPRPDQ